MNLGINWHIVMTKKLTNLASLFIAAAYGLSSDEPGYKFLQFVDLQPNHCIYEAEMSGDQLMQASELIDRGYLMHVPDGNAVIADKQTYRKQLVPVTSDSPRYRARYVVTSKGSYALGTFLMDTLHQERHKH